MTQVDAGSTQFKVDRRWIDGDPRALTRINVEQNVPRRKPERGTSADSRKLQLQYHHCAVVSPLCKLTLVVVWEGYPSDTYRPPCTSNDFFHGLSVPKRT